MDDVLKHSHHMCVRFTKVRSLKIIPIGIGVQTPQRQHNEQCAKRLSFAGPRHDIINDT